MAAFKKRGLKVVPFKIGPDFIDPGHHTNITKVASRNLDGWMLEKSYNKECFLRSIYESKADIAVIEGVMGLFDGYDGKTDAGSTAQMAKWLGINVILIVNAKSMARSAAAIVMGFEKFDPDLNFTGVIFNKTGSDRHLKYLKDALPGHVNLRCLGGIPRDDSITMKERHLGLVTNQDQPLSENQKQNLSDIIENNINIDQLLKELPEIDITIPVKKDNLIRHNSRARIAVAKDKAFCFYYEDNFDLLKNAGAELIFFSPINDKSLPDNIDGIYLGGGYPELYARKLSENISMRGLIKKKSISGMPIYGECGGFIYLCKKLYDKSGSIFPMTGCFPFSAKMFNKLKALGYREITITKNTLLGGKGKKIKGHEFHYSNIVSEPSHNIEKVFQVTKRDYVENSAEGYLTENTLGSYMHLHFGSKPDTAHYFTEACRKYKKERKKNETS